jgi:hypothetical protein
LAKIEKLRIEYEFNEKRIDLLNKKVDILYKIMFIFIVGIITLNMNNYYFEENQKMQEKNMIQQKANFELNYEQKYQNIDELKNPNISTEEWNALLIEIEKYSAVISEELKKSIAENKKISEYLIDFFKWQFYLICFFIVLLMRYYIQIILIGRKNELIRKKIIENPSPNYYKDKRI